MPVPSSRSLLLSLGAFVLALSQGACGGGTSSGPSGSDSGPILLIIPPKKDAGTDAAVKPDASTPADAGADVAVGPSDAELNTYPAFTVPAPQVQHGGGPTLTNAIFIPVIFAGDEYATQIPTYLQAVATSQYWLDVGKDYGVAAATSSPPIILNETFPSSLDDNQLQVWLANKLGLDPRFGAIGESVFDAGGSDGGGIDANAPFSDAASRTATAPTGAIYVIFLPGGTQVSLQGQESCVYFGGYHNSFYYGPNGSTVVYAAIPRCGSFETSSGILSGFNAISGPTSHELIEAASDPEVASNSHYGFDGVDLNDEFWSIVLGGAEVGDMCAQFPGAFYTPSEAALSSYMVQRIWSNSAAAAGHDPCVPTPSAQAEPFYFNSVPQNTEVTATYFGNDFPTQGIVAPIGQPTTINVRLFSNVSTMGQTWTVTAVDANSLFMGSAPVLSFGTTQVSGLNGDTVQLTVTNAGMAGVTTHPYIIESQLGILTNWWIGIVVDN